MSYFAQQNPVVKQQLHSENLPPGDCSQQDVNKIRVDKGVVATTASAAEKLGGPAHAGKAVPGKENARNCGLALRSNGNVATTGRHEAETSGRQCHEGEPREQRRRLEEEEEQQEQQQAEQQQQHGEQRLQEVQQEKLHQQKAGPVEERKQPEAVKERRPATGSLSDITPYDYYPPYHMPAGIVDIDRQWLEHPAYPGHYAKEIFEYLRERETHFIGEWYLGRQPEINPLFRRLVVDWLAELQGTFGLRHETLYLSVKIVDRYLSRETVFMPELQLVAACALLITMKLDEPMQPSNQNLAYLCDWMYVPAQFSRMEMRILAALDFDVTMPVSYTFLRRYCHSIGLDIREMTLARFVLECALMDMTMIVRLESHVAAAALLLTLDILGRSWDDTLKFYTGYEQWELTDTRDRCNEAVHYLKELYERGDSAIQATVSKYSQKEFFRVADAVFPPV